MTETADTSGALFTTAPLAVSVRELHVKFRVYEDLGRPGQRRRGLRSRTATEVHAVKGVSLDVHKGEAVGLIGSNGSGKSTLLQSIAGLQAKASGSVLVRGDASLLGVGATLKKELSGYRNVMLGGLAMGMSRSEVEERIPEVATFSGLGPALGRPMKTYSSGMRARLAFSIATLRVPDILLIDEALAVGDRKFKRRSLKRINEIRDNAGTVIMVTHNMNEIRKTCTRVVWLEQGVIVMDGSVDEVLEAYESEK